MMGSVLLFVFSLWLVWLYHRDIRERDSVSGASWIVLLWTVSHGTRPISSWFLDADTEPFASRDEGNPIEASIDLFLIICGFIILARRRVRLSVFANGNTWLLLLYTFWFMSIFWSDYPFITFKRVFRDLGSVMMALVVLTDLNPGQTMRAVCTRLVYATIPLSILLYKYFPQLGRVYAGYSSNDQMYVGVATHKNTLGVLAMVGIIFLVWDLMEDWEKRRIVKQKASVASKVLVLMMCWYLLLTIDCVTSLVCAVLGVILLMTLRLTSMGRQPGRMEIVGLVTLSIFVLLDVAFGVTEAFVQSLGRDMTLTTRTDIWSIVKEYQGNPLVGVGFNTFWAGDRYKLLAEKTGGVIQAHNGYLEVYLNGGWIGIGLLIGVLIFTYWRVRNQLVLGLSESVIRFVILILSIIHNYSEASFNKTVLLWFVGLFAIVQYSVKKTPLAET